MRTSIILLLAIFLFQCGGKSFAQEQQLDVLIVTDDRKFNREAFFVMFDSFDNLQWTEIAQSKMMNLIGSGDLKKYDAFVFYDMPEKVVLTAEQKQIMKKWFEEGAPAVFLHHSLLSYREWDAFPDIIGGRFYNKTPFITSTGDTIQSEYQHDVRYKVLIEDKEHPITNGMDDFEILDETYKNYVVNDDVELLLTTDHPSSGPAIAWINTYGNSKIVYLINGHNESAYDNPNYRQLLFNAINWVASGTK